jgi:hypothetical protein
MGLTQNNKKQSLVCTPPFVLPSRSQTMFHASPEAHFAIEPCFYQLQAWICTYGEMIIVITHEPEWPNAHHSGLWVPLQYLTFISSHPLHNFTLTVPLFPSGLGTFTPINRFQLWAKIEIASPSYREGQVGGPAVWTSLLPGTYVVRSAHGVDFGFSFFCRAELPGCCI